MEFREAVEILINQKPSDSSQYAEKASYTKAESQRKLFTLPAKAANMHRLYAYLCKTRSIAPEVISHFVHAGTLYEEAQFHNAVFIATDENGNPCGGMKKGTLSGTSFRQTITGSDTHYAFHHKGSSGRVYVFEAAVDMLSYISLYPQDWQQHSYLALDGLSPKSLLHFLDKYEGVREICLCLDNDAAGIEATERITVQLQEREYTDVSVLVPELKDWNEAAVAQTHAQDFPEPEMTMD